MKKLSCFYINKILSALLMSLFKKIIFSYVAVSTNFTSVKQEGYKLHLKLDKVHEM